MVSIAALATARALRRASRQPLPQADGPDWLTDMIALGEQVAARFGQLRPHATRAVLLADRYAVKAISRHPLLVAGGPSLAFGFTTALAQGLQERYTLGVYLVLFMNHAAGMFAYLALIGAFLGIAGTPRQRAATRSAAARRCAVRAGIAACVSIPVTGAFRAQLWSLLGQPGRLQPYDLITLMLGAAAATAAPTYAAETITERAGRRRPERPPP